MKNLQSTIESAWEKRSDLSSATQGEIRDAVNTALAALDSGQMRIAENANGAWVVNQWLKKAVLLSFRLNDSHEISGGVGGTLWWDKVQSKFTGWNAAQFSAAGFRAVPNCVVRYSTYIAPGAVLMPSFINVGAYIGEGTMIDIGAAIGSCAQIGKHCHISANTMIGGVLEPLQAEPVIIEDNVFVGACCGIAEGVVVEEGAVIAMGTMIGASTKIIDRATGEILQGRVPSYSVVVAGSLPGETPNAPALSCAVIVKRVDEKTRAKTSVNELLRG
jgi:2,3,4,5-tetrahydropyridine-2-carboxylate N-succinyltransferase